jgi:hypothetical protein
VTGGRKDCIIEFLVKACGYVYTCRNQQKVIYEMILPQRYLNVQHVEDFILNNKDIWVAICNSLTFMDDT